MLPAGRGRDGRHRAHVRRQARRAARREPGVPGPGSGEPRGRARPRAARSAAGCRSRSSTRKAARAPRCRGPSQRGWSWWSSCSSRTCCGRCRSRCWPPWCWSRSPGCSSVSSLQPACGAPTARSSSSPPAALLGVLGSGLLRGVLIGAAISLVQLGRRASRSARRGPRADPRHAALLGPRTAPGQRGGARCARAAPRVVPSSTSMRTTSATRSATVRGRPPLRRAWSSSTSRPPRTSICRGRTLTGRAGGRTPGRRHQGAGGRGALVGPRPVPPGGHGRPARRREPVRLGGRRGGRVPRGREHAPLPLVRGPRGGG